MLIAFAAVCLLQEPGLWDGFAPGSWVQLSYGPWAAEESRFRLLPRVEGTPSTPRATLLDGFRETGRRRESLTIRDQAVACDVLDFAPAEAPPGRTVALTLWRAGNVAVPPRELYVMGAMRSMPVDVLGLTLVEESRADITVRTLRAIDLDAPLDVAGRRLSCTAEQGSVVWQGGGRFTRRDFTQWLSAEVPGSLVRKDRSCTDKPDRPAHTYMSRDQVVDFHVVR